MRIAMRLQVQTIGLLSYVKHKGVNGPFLVIGPLSTLTNWVNEFQRFCPDMPALLYHGSPREREVLRRTRMRVGEQRAGILRERRVAG